MFQMEEIPSPLTRDDAIRQLEELTAAPHNEPGQRNHFEARSESNNVQEQRAVIPHPQDLP